MTEENKAGTSAPKPGKKSAGKRQAQAEQAKDKLAQSEGQPKNVNPIVLDETYSGLREDNRVVMRRTIAVNLENFRAAPKDFDPRSGRDFPLLAPVAAPFFSVIIPTYNAAPLLPDVLDALDAQRFRDAEVIVVDDASTDDSVQLLAERYPWVRVIVNRRNLGFVQSCNTGAAAARGRYLVLLNNDTEPEPGWLEALAKAAAANADAAIIASKLLLFDRRTVLHTTGDLVGADGIPVNRGVWEQDHGQYDQATAIFSGCGGASAYRKDVWEALGGFDEDFWMYLEDVDYGFRAQLLGFRAVFAPEARVYHRLSASGGGMLASYYVGRNTIWLIAKNMPRGLLLRNAGRILGGQLRVTLDALGSVRGAAARARLRGQWDGLLGLPHQLAKRRLIQPRRQVDDATLARRLTA